MGHSLRRLLDDLAGCAGRSAGRFCPAELSRWPGAARRAAWAIPAEDALAAYLWAWAENQVMAALKAVPLGQTAGQRCCWRWRPHPGLAAEAAHRARSRTPRNFLPGLRHRQRRHETQYSRLFRS